MITTTTCPRRCKKNQLMSSEQCTTQVPRIVWPSVRGALKDAAWHWSRTDHTRSQLPTENESNFLTLSETLRQAAEAELYLRTRWIEKLKNKNKKLEMYGKPCRCIQNHGVEIRPLCPLRQGQQDRALGELTETTLQGWSGESSHRDSE